VISPELVLVDPELAVLWRESLRENAAADPAPASSSQPGSTSVAAAMAFAPPLTPGAGRWRRRVRAGLFTLSIAANLLLLMMVADSRSGSLPQLVVAPPLRPPVTPSEGTPSRAADASRQIDNVVRQAEKRVLAGLQRDATLRRRFVDPSTGLPRTGVLARCRPRDSGPNGAATLLCVVERQLGLRRVTSTVRYQTLPHGRYSIAAERPGHAG
jgi:hypothetical protein